MLLLELTKRLNNSDPQVRYVLTYLYEMFNEQQKQLNMLTNIAVSLAEHNEMIIQRLGLSQTNTADTLEELHKFGRTDGVDVSSVAADPDKDE